VNRDFFSCSTFISVPPFWAEVRTTQSFAQVAVLPTRAALIFTIVPSLTHPAAASTYLLAVRASTYTLSRTAAHPHLQDPPPRGGPGTLENPESASRTGNVVSSSYGQFTHIRRRFGGGKTLSACSLL
jgi:hypothetical protein